MTYNGEIGEFDAIDQYLDGATYDNNGNIQPLPTTPQDELPHKDGLFGRNYQGYDPAQVGRTGNDVLNTHFDGDHVDVIERAPNGGMYHDRIGL